MRQGCASALWPSVAVVVPESQLGMAYGLMAAFQVCSTALPYRPCASESFRVRAAFLPRTSIPALPAPLLGHSESF